jgi:hypothetical protein
VSPPGARRELDIEDPAALAGVVRAAGPDEGRAAIPHRLVYGIPMGGSLVRPARELAASRN